MDPENSTPNKSIQPQRPPSLIITNFQNQDIIYDNSSPIHLHPSHSTTQIPHNASNASLDNLSIATEHSVGEAAIRENQSVKQLLEQEFGIIDLAKGAKLKTSVSIDDLNYFSDKKSVGTVLETLESLKELETLQQDEKLFQKDETAVEEMEEGGNGSHSNDVVELPPPTPTTDMTANTEPKIAPAKHADAQAMVTISLTEENLHKHLNIIGPKPFVESSSSASNTTSDSGHAAMLNAKNKKPSKENIFTFTFKMLYNFLRRRTYIYSFLTVVGLLGGFIVFVHDIAIRYIFLGRTNFIAQIDAAFGKDANSPWVITLQVLLSILYNLLFVAVGMVCYWISPDTEGSGIPAIKAIVNQAVIHGPLSLKTLIFKCIALPCILGANLYFGKIGPTIHIGAALANVFMNFPLFKNIKKNRDLAVQMIQCGCAIGVGANFGSPVGGVLFAVEIVGTYYSLKTYVKSFYCALLSAVTTRLLHSFVNGTPFITPPWRSMFSSIAIPWSSLEIFSFIGLGVICGILGALFVYCNYYILKARLTFGTRRFGFFNFGGKWLFFLENQYLFAILICVVTSIVSHPKVIGGYMSSSPTSLMEDFLWAKPMLASEGANRSWFNPQNPNELFINLFIFIIIRVVISIFTISLALPGGMYVPFLVIGAAIGRFYGEVLHYFFPAIIPGGYAWVGAAALTASFCQAYSTIFILLEIVGTAFYIPSLIASFFAIRIGQYLGLSAYDSIISLFNWQTIGELLSDKTDKIDTTRVLKKCEYFLTEREKIGKINEYLKKYCNILVFPVVVSPKIPLLLGEINRSELKAIIEVLKRKFDEVKDQPSTEIVSNSKTEIEMVDLCQFTKTNENFEELEIVIPYSSCLTTLSEHASIAEAHKIFSLLKMDEICVVSRGKLKGVITKQELKGFASKVRPFVHVKAANAIDAYKKFLAKSSVSARNASNYV